MAIPCSLSITTKPASSSGLTLHKLMDHSATLGCGPATMARKSTGTTVGLTNIFGRLPIRKKRMVPRLELDDIVKRVGSGIFGLRWAIYHWVDHAITAGHLARPASRLEAMDVGGR